MKENKEWQETVNRILCTLSAKEAAAFEQHIIDGKEPWEAHLLALRDTEEDEFTEALLDYLCGDRMG